MWAAKGTLVSVKLHMVRPGHLFLWTTDTERNTNPGLGLWYNLLWHLRVLYIGPVENKVSLYICWLLQITLSWILKSVFSFSLIFVHLFSKTCVTKCFFFIHSIIWGPVELYSHIRPGETDTSVTTDLWFWSLHSSHQSLIHSHRSSDLSGLAHRHWKYLLSIPALLWALRICSSPSSLLHCSVPLVRAPSFSLWTGSTGSYYWHSLLPAQP